MKAYEKYCQDVLEGKIITCLYIKQIVQRFIDFRNREDIWFDDQAVDDCERFVGMIKHYKGKTAGESFKLTPWQSLLVACIVGLKWKSDDTRVCREVYLQIARKAGKSCLIAALALYFLIADGEASPEVACLATTREQAGIIFDMITEFAKSLDPNGSDIKKYRNYIKTPANKGTCKIFSSDANRLDGLNISFGVIDEYAALPNDDLYSVIKSSMAMREQPLLVQITTPQFNLMSPAYAKYQMGIEILAGIKEDDSFWPFLFTLDEGDEWDDPEVWIKSNPNLGLTVAKEFIEAEVNNAKNNPSQEVPVKTKTLGIWCSSAMTWIPRETISKYMEDIDIIKEFEGAPCYIGVDLGSVSDFTSISILVIDNDNDGNPKYYFDTRTFLPEDTLLTHPQAEQYKEFIREGSMIKTPGNVADYEYLLKMIMDISEKMSVIGCWYDQWNATSFAINATLEGINMVPYSQAIGNFNAPTKEFERLLLQGDVVINKSSNVLWQFGNVELKMDHNGNVKPDKSKYQNKIDSVISMITALGGSLKEPVETDFNIFKI